jgi:uncharacterized protein
MEGFRDDERSSGGVGVSNSGAGMTMLEKNIQIPWVELCAFAERNPIERLAFFGSVLSDDFGPESDVDILVWLEDNARIGYFALCAMENELTELFGRKVDFRTPAELSPYFRDDVIAGCVVFHAVAASAADPFKQRDILPSTS